jgi:GntR family transcriptional regulator/MocR family aminotransferase
MRAVAISRLIDLDPRGRTPLARQIERALGQAILAGQLPLGTRLPSTRALAVDLGVSRNTVVEAFDQLTAERYLETRPGAGTFVSLAVAAESRRLRAPAPATRVQADARRAATGSARTRRIRDLPLSISDDTLRPFNPGLPALDRKLLDGWFRVTAECHRHVKSADLNYGDAAGFLGLRAAIAAHVVLTRGVTCTADQVIVTGGTQQAVDLASRVLLDENDAVWIEDPGYLGSRAAVAAAGARLVPVAVDDQGLSVVDGRRRAKDARMACVAPSHQYPLGVTMSLSRRLELLEWAAKTGAWILEDDYDSEFQYGGGGVPALQGLDAAGSVIYMGTFSKILFPALRLGYLIAPVGLVDVFRAGMTLMGHGLPTLPQVTMARFMDEGHFIRHLRRMRDLYAERNGLFREEVAARFAGALELIGTATGLHVTGRLATGLDDQRISAKAASEGIAVPALSRYAMEASDLSGLVMGYAHLTPARIRAGMVALSAAFDAARQGAGVRRFSS